jgi:hypothetical protein
MSNFYFEPYLIAVKQSFTPYFYSAKIFPPSISYPTENIQLFQLFIIQLFLQFSIWPKILFQWSYIPQYINCAPKEAKHKRNNNPNYPSILIVNHQAVLTSELPLKIAIRPRRKKGSQKGFYVQKVLSTIFRV